MSIGFHTRIGTGRAWVKYFACQWVVRTCELNLSGRFCMMFAASSRDVIMAGPALVSFSLVRLAAASDTISPCDHLLRNTAGSVLCT